MSAKRCHPPAAARAPTGRRLPRRDTARAARVIGPHIVCQAPFPSCRVQKPPRAGLVPAPGSGACRSSMATEQESRRGGHARSPPTRASQPLAVGVAAAAPSGLLPPSLSLSHTGPRAMAAATGVAGGGHLFDGAAGPVAFPDAGHLALGPAPGAAHDAAPHGEAERVRVVHGARHQVFRHLRRRRGGGGGGGRPGGRVRRGSGGKYPPSRGGPGCKRSDRAAHTSPSQRLKDSD